MSNFLTDEASDKAGVVDDIEVLSLTWHDDSVVGSVVGAVVGRLLNETTVRECVTGVGNCEAQVVTAEKLSSMDPKVICQTTSRNE